MLTLRIEQRQVLSQEQRARQRLEQQLSFRIELLQTLRQDDQIYYNPEALCPACHHTLTIGEILAGFNNDPYDINTTCPNCGFKFIAKMAARTFSGEITFPFYCPCQTLQVMRQRNMDFLRPKELLNEHREIYASAIFHFGNLGSAFKQIDIDYRFKEPADKAWTNKAKPYFGLVPDTELAKIFAVSASTIGRVRRSLGYGAYVPGEYD